MGDQTGDCTAGYSRAHTIGAAGQNYGYSRAQDQAGAVSIGEEGELLGKDVAGFEVWRDQDVRITGDLRNNAFCLCCLFADGIVKCQRTIEYPASDLPALGHLA